MQRSTSCDAQCAKGRSTHADSEHRAGDHFDVSRVCQLYVERHVTAQKLSRAGSVNWRLRPFVERFGDRAVKDIKTGDIEDFIAALRKPRMLYGREHVLRAASVNRTIEILRHMLNWAVGRKYWRRRRSAEGRRRSSRSCAKTICVGGVSRKTKRRGFSRTRRRTCDRR